MTQSLYLEREMKVYVYTKFSTYIFMLFVIAPNWEPLQCPSTGKWLSKLYYNCTIGCFSAIKVEKP